MSAHNSKNLIIIKKYAKSYYKYKFKGYRIENIILRKPKSKKI